MDCAKSVGYLNADNDCSGCASRNFRPNNSVPCSVTVCTSAIRILEIFSIMDAHWICIVSLLYVMNAIAQDTPPKNQATSEPATQEYITNKLNTYRREVGGSNMQLLTWDPEVQAIAQKFADKCSPTFPTNDALRRAYLSTPKYKCGANVGRGTELIDWGDILQMWYNTSVNFEYGSTTEKEGVSSGFYTAMIWAKSFGVGCGFNKCEINGKKNGLFVCNFCPAGNLVTSKSEPYEKGEPCGKCPNACDEGLCTNPCPYTNQYGNCDKLFPKKCAVTVKEVPQLKDVVSKCPATCKCRDNGLLY
ncbi:cysteine-rich venom protein latisemin-like [Paramacrobiotus metropolitanus]|uniref:cysteine-rich venom protein latisemin-like n=1 Tax=Paramacrobiotus metropolitanus TaxID=2943436 RepID=UPI0024459B53|nr:cysteine-rich venom protein latisemin-like [Paramacrobiotus metropolitanus]